MPWLAVIPLALWIYLVFAHGQFWRTSIRLPETPPPPRWPAVSVIIPARDEAEMLPLTLPTVLAQDYPGPARVILVDDHSGDGTGALARRLGQRGNGLPLTVVTSEQRPEGWTGKLWALHAGTEAACPGDAAGAGPGATCSGKAVPAEWLLYTDADIAHHPDSLRRLIAWAQAGNLDSVSLMARLRTATGWERLIVPAFVYFFAQLYPFRRVNSPQSRCAAAAGGCVLVRASALARAGGVAKVRGAVIDDVALAGALKRSGANIWLGLADEVASVRPYPRLSDLWDMVARSAFTQLRYSAVLLAGTLAGLILVFIGPPAALAAGLAARNPTAAVAGAAAWALMAGSYLPILRYYGCRPWRALTLPFVAALYGAMTATSALRHWRGGVTWKGRHY